MTTRDMWWSHNAWYVTYATIKVWHIVLVTVWESLHSLQLNVIFEDSIRKYFILMNYYLLYIVLLYYYNYNNHSMLINL